MRDTASRFGPVSQGFHWLTVALFTIQFGIAIYMEELPRGLTKLEWVTRHKSIGFTILMLVVLRLIWRRFNQAPDLPEGMPKWEQTAAHATQHALYLVMVLMPISGLMMSWAANYPVSVYGWFTLPSLVAPSDALKDIMVVVHEVIAWIIVALLGLHVAGALRHHFVLKDDVLRRMLPGGKD